MASPLIKPDSAPSGSASAPTRTGSVAQGRTLILDDGLLADLKTAAQVVEGGKRGPSLSGLSRAERAKLLFKLK